MNDYRIERALARHHRDPDPVREPAAPSTPQTRTVILLDTDGSPRGVIENAVVDDHKGYLVLTYSAEQAVAFSDGKVF